MNLQIFQTFYTRLLVHYLSCCVWSRFPHLDSYPRLPSNPICNYFEHAKSGPTPEGWPKISMLYKIPPRVERSLLIIHSVRLGSANTYAISIHICSLFMCWFWLICIKKSGYRFSILEHIYIFIKGFNDNSVAHGARPQTVDAHLSSLRDLQT